jgi:SAM-dependent methyltransferase
MGINLEYITLLNILRVRGDLPDSGSVLEFGAQDISAKTNQVKEHLSRMNVSKRIPLIESAADLYAYFGIENYECIDANGRNSSMVYDLNQNLGDKYGFLETYDLVTNLGTLEHCFNIANGFMNMHATCKNDGIMIHVMPTQSNVNHGFYNIQPRLLANMAAANKYEILHFYFTVDYQPELYLYNLDNYKMFDDRDLMVYCVFRKKSDDPFRMPFDDIFSAENYIPEYFNETISEDFSAYIKDKWENITPDSIDSIPCVPSRNIRSIRRLKKRLIDFLGKTN